MQIYVFVLMLFFLLSQLFFGFICVTCFPLSFFSRLFFLKIIVFPFETIFKRLKPNFKRPNIIYLWQTQVIVVIRFYTHNAIKLHWMDQLGITEILLLSIYDKLHIFAFFELYECDGLAYKLTPNNCSQFPSLVFSLIEQQRSEIMSQPSANQMSDKMTVLALQFHRYFLNFKEQKLEGKGLVFVFN